MVRRLPKDDHNPIIHPAISLTLFAVGIAAAMAMITALCGVWFRRKPPPSESSSPKAAAANENKEDVKEGDGTEDGGSKELPLPPMMQQVANPSQPSQVLKSASERKESHVKSMSVKVPRSLSVVKTQLEEGIQRKREKMRGEESVWTKTIILGEKCKVSEEEDGVIYEGKGKKISAYHPRGPSSISKQSSAIDAEALPSPEQK